MFSLVIIFFGFPIFQRMTECETGLFGCSHDNMDARRTSALAPALSPGEGESFAAPLKIYTTGLAGRSSTKPETGESDFLSWGRG